MISMGFVEQPGSASTRYETSDQTRGVAALPSVIGGPGLDFKMPSFEATPRSEDTPSLTVVIERSAMAEATAGGFHARGICGRHDQGRRVAAAVLLFLAIISLAPKVASAQGLCIPPLDALKRAMCSDPELRGLLEIGQRGVNFLWPLLSPPQQQQFTADHRSWREAIAAGCRLADFPGLPLVAAVKDCLRDANQSRITWLRDYSAMPARGPPPRAPVIPRLSADVASTAAPGGPIRLVPPPSPQSSGGPSVGGVVPGGALVPPAAAPTVAPPAPPTAGVSPAPSIALVGSPLGSGAVLGVIDGTSVLIETIPQSSGSHSVAADCKRNKIFVPLVAPDCRGWDRRRHQHDSRARQPNCGLTDLRQQQWMRRCLHSRHRRRGP